MPDIERPVSFYDEIFREKIWEKPELTPRYNYIIAEFKRLGVRSILDVGCGMGALLSLCRDSGFACYGFDFSPIAIEVCKERNKLENVWIGNALDEENYADDYDAYLATQVLEHITRDLDVIGNLKPGVPFIFSVPSYANVGSGHVRCFKSADTIRERYGEIIDIKSIEKVTKRWVVIASTVKEGIQ